MRPVLQKLIFEESESGTATRCISLLFAYLMEVQKKEAHSLQKIAAQRICFLEMTEKEVESEVRSWTEKFVASERKRRVEVKKEESPFSEIALLHLRLGPRHHITSQALRNKLFFHQECANVRGLQGFNGYHHMTLILLTTKCNAHCYTYVL